MSFEYFYFLVVLSIRTWAVWARDKKIGLGMLAMFGVTWVAICFVMAKFLDSMQCNIGPLTSKTF